MDEGYIKFSFDLIEKELPKSLDWENLESVRKSLFKKGLIGNYPDGIGFGNISKRVRNSEFLITGSATGGIKDLSLSDYCLVNEYDLAQNYVKGTGKISPSSESMSHGAIYSATKAIHAVIHIHSKKLFDQMLTDQKLPRTHKGIRYGTPEMASAIADIVNLINKNSGYFVTAGHDEGIFAFGENLEIASLQIHKISKKYS
ncbi:MAG: class II aldolase/adducin family protein [Opitutae bacterium]|jgi:L-ribulose-5-phosphate 4-epimerase|nr:class II aldolase/adducin family protein [Opitutae bacterium]